MGLTATDIVGTCPYPAVRSHRGQRWKVASGGRSRHIWREMMRVNDSDSLRKALQLGRYGLTEASI